MNLTEFYKFKSICGSGSGGSDSDDSTVVIYDGDIVLTNEYYEGTFVPLVVPESGTDLSPSTLTVLFNDHEYNLIQVAERTWDDDPNLANRNISVDYIDEEWYFCVINTDLLPSTELPQTVAVKITQDLSYSSGKDYSRPVIQ